MLVNVIEIDLISMLRNNLLQVSRPRESLSRQPTFNHAHVSISIDTDFEIRVDTLLLAPQPHQRVVEKGADDRQDNLMNIIFGASKIVFSSKYGQICVDFEEISCFSKNLSINSKSAATFIFKLNSPYFVYTFLFTKKLG